MHGITARQALKVIKMPPPLYAPCVGQKRRIDMSDHTIDALCSLALAGFVFLAFVMHWIFAQ